MRSSKNKLITVHGVLIPYKWTEHDGIELIAISGTDEREYIIEDRDSIAVLREHLHSPIKATGTLIQSGKTRYMEIKNWELLQNPVYKDPE